MGVVSSRSRRVRVRRLGAGAAPLEDLAIGRLDAHDVRDGDLAEQVGHRLEQDWREAVFIVVGQRRNKTYFQDALYALRKQALS